jgi:molybdenum cofactor cytidylyltransferase
MSTSVAAIVLAAGASRRLGQPKQLLIHGGETLLARAVRLAKEAGAAPILVILGANSQLIRETVAMTDAIPIINEEWEQGIAASIHAGINALDATAPNVDGALILTCDQPRLTTAHLRTLIDTFCVQQKPTIVASAYAAVLGIPAAFPRMAFANLLALKGDKGARSLLADPPCPLIAVAFTGGEVDIDQPEDLAQLE